jgi:hypothetical protein
MTTVKYHTNKRRTSIPSGQKMDSKLMEMERLNGLWGDGKGNGKNQFQCGFKTSRRARSKRLN